MELEQVEIQKSLKRIDKSLVKNGFLNMPASIAIGLGLFSIFAHNPESLHPLLGEAYVSNCLFVFGIPLSVFCAYRMVKLNKIKNGLISQLNT